MKNLGKKRSVDIESGALADLFWYPRLGWETSLFLHINNGKSDVSQPNRGYQNRPLDLDGKVTECNDYETDSEIGVEDNPFHDECSDSN
ncbi:hypothetical protein AVEN_220961-1 [Araneus ventricosus]|uniref:Uncharacterized protein n=1 Tax=Araneus ventricosus TaxID=182803 RepID=A0A4Y2H8T1_ARAVE|nr:hypothetical protein AVEN_220961-1 [Araneus ventricosus]